MTEEPPLDARITTVERALAKIEDRLNVIEHGAPHSPGGSLHAHADGGVALPRVDVAGAFALAGRAVVLCAGAFVLRALTEAGVVPQFTGAILGLAYALMLAVVADRVAPRHAASASFLGACTVIISVPLLWEITSRFALITPAASAVALTIITTVVLGVAWRRSLQALAWITTIGACLLAGALLMATGTYLPFASFLILLGVATLWLGYDREWIGLRWIAAAFADLSIALLIGRAAAAPPLETPAVVMATLIVLVVGYLGSTAIRTLVRNRDLLPFEAAQATAVLALGVGGAVLIARRTGAGASTLGPTLLVLAAGAYLVALIHRESHARAANYYFYTTLAIVFAVTGGLFTFGHASAAGLWTVLALGMSWLARRYGRSTLHLHAAAYLVLGAVGTGLAVVIFDSLFGQAVAARSIGSWLVAIAVLICWWTAAMTPASKVTESARTVLVLLLILTGAGLCVGWLYELLMRNVNPQLGPAVLATTRTAAIAGGAVIVAWLSAHRKNLVSGWLLYPLLAWGLLKLLFEDFRVSPPSLLVVAMGLYGGALIVAPRLAKNAGRAVD